MLDLFTGEASGIFHQGSLPGLLLTALQALRFHF